MCACVCVCVCVCVCTCRCMCTCVHVPDSIYRDATNCFVHMFDKRLRLSK